MLEEARMSYIKTVVQVTRDVAKETGLSYTDASLAVMITQLFHIKLSLEGTDLSTESQKGE